VDTRGEHLFTIVATTGTMIKKSETRTNDGQAVLKKDPKKEGIE
jgi:hypothetical protein